MLQGNGSMPIARRRRVKFIKNAIILVLLLSFFMPLNLCIVLFWKVNVVERNLEQASGQLAEVAILLEEQIQYTRELQEQLQYTKETGELEATVILPVNAQVQEGREHKAAEGPEILAISEMDGKDSAEGGGAEDGSAEKDDTEEAIHKVYLTFDDGPSIYTDDILDILDRYEIKATFFVVGKEDERSQMAMREIVERGHTLGMHSYSHVYKSIYNSIEDFSEDFYKIQNYIYEVTGIESMVYRFPGGSSNTITDVDILEFAGYLESQNVKYYDWNISSGDGGDRLLNVHAIVKNCTLDIAKFPTSIILMHDAASKRTTVEALPIIIENILAMEDTVFLPISEDTEPIQHIHN